LYILERMRFFDRQKSDQIGILGVKLQKILIFLGIVDFFAFFHVEAFGWLFTWVSLCAIVCGFFGAYKRRERLLHAYVIFNVIFILLSVISVAMLIAMDNNGADMAARDPMPTITVYDSAKLNHDTNKPVSLKPAPENPEPAKVIPSTRLTLIHKKQKDLDNHSNENRAEDSFSVLGLLILVFLWIILALKIASIVMAARMAKMIQANRKNHLEHPVIRKSPALAPFTFPQNQQQQIMYMAVPPPPAPNGAMYFPYPPQGPFMQHQPMYNPYVVPQPMATARV